MIVIYERIIQSFLTLFFNHQYTLLRYNYFKVSILSLTNYAFILNYSIITLLQYFTDAVYVPTMNGTEELPKLQTKENLDL